jgi:hypothetical protein
MSHWYTQDQLAAGRRGDMDRAAAKETLRSEARASRVRSSARDGSLSVRLQGLGKTLAEVIRERRAAVLGIHR